MLLFFAAYRKSSTVSLLSSGSLHTEAVHDLVCDDLPGVTVRGCQVDHLLPPLLPHEGPAARLGVIDVPVDGEPQPGVDVAVLLLAVLYEGDAGGGLLNVRHHLQDESLCLWEIFLS